ncbi:MAG TPA: hypothetical protein VGP93_20775, partial [Polyangiaceae bacterium]|nr:hypothetical protein [Polyangiaceae bacterium]
MTGTGGAAAGSTAQGGSGAGGSSTGGSTGGSAAGGSSAAGSASAGTTGSGGSVPTSCISNEQPGTAPASTWINAASNLANMPAGCGTLSRVAAKPCSKSILAGVADKGLWQSDDSGQSWTALGTGGGSASITNNPLSILFDPEHPDTIWESGLFGGGGLYTSTNAGQTFQQLGPSSMNQLLSVDFGDPERKTMVFGLHGYKQQVWRSTDGGAGWTQIGLNIPATAHNAESPLVIDAQTYLVGACGTSGDGTCAIYRTSDSGSSFNPVSDVKVSHFAAPLWASDGTIYWPLLFSAGLAKSTDLGQTWTTVIANTVKDVTPIELPDGSIISVGMDHIVRSTDGGVSFQNIGETLPFAIDGGYNGGVTYSALN